MYTMTSHPRSVFRCALSNTTHSLGLSALKQEGGFLRALVVYYYAHRYLAPVANRLRTYVAHSSEA